MNDEKKNYCKQVFKNVVFRFVLKEIVQGSWAEMWNDEQKAVLQDGTLKPPMDAVQQGRRFSSTFTNLNKKQVSVEVRLPHYAL